MKIITAIYVYRFHVVISYLNHGISIVPFRDKRDKFHGSVKFKEEFEFPAELIELNAKGNTLFGTSNNSLYSTDLTANYNSRIEKSISNEIFDKKLSQLSIDYDLNNLFAYSSDEGIFQLNINNPKNPKLINTIIPKEFEKIGNPIITNMVTSKNNMLISIRNHGTAHLTNEDNKFRNKTTIRSTDPQDVNFIYGPNIITIADQEDGVLLFHENSTKPFETIKLPNNDFPQQVGKIHQSIVIKGKYGLYLYNLYNSHLSVIREGKIGTFATFYEYLFFSSSGKIYVQNLNNHFENNFMDLNEKNPIEIIRSSFK